MKFLKQLARSMRYIIKKALSSIRAYCMRHGILRSSWSKANLGSGTLHIGGYANIDIDEGSDLIIDLNKTLVPFPDNALDVVACMSAINYFSYDRATAIIKDVYRALKPGGIARFGAQDLRLIAEKYVANDTVFFFQKSADGRDRFPGATTADKVNAWFYGYPSGRGAVCKYVYDYESLAHLFTQAGFSIIERKAYCESAIAEVESIDNRPEQMFFLEAKK